MTGGMGPTYVCKLPLKTFFLCVAALVFGTCGLEDYPYIYPVPQGNIDQELNNSAEVHIPTSNSGTAFSHFVIFYRIYVSNINLSSTKIGDAAIYPDINPVLATDYNSINLYIDSDTLVNTNMDSLFQGKGFKYLYLENADIENVLSSSVLGNTLKFYFPSQVSNGLPTMTIGSSVYYLMRSTGNGSYNPKPDNYRYFVNNDELWDPDYITPQFNADVVDKSGISGGEHYTYAAMFIVAVGIDNSTYSYIYSTPSLIHVFLLPNP